MELEQILHVNGGGGENSYANNSAQQKEAILKAKPLLEQSLNHLFHNVGGSFPECIRFVDMGCSSGPNSLFPTWEAIDSLHKICSRLNRKPPVLHAFLNDLPGNDFNTTFKSLPSFYERLRAEKGRETGCCFVAAAPGSFHGRLFPSNFLHFVYSASALHWLSRGLVEESKVKSFSAPNYQPYVEEVKQIIKREGSFEIHYLEPLPLSWLAGFSDHKNLESDKYAKGKFLAGHIRAVGESLLANHFGDGAVIDELYRRFAIKVTDDEILEKGTESCYTFLLVSLVKKNKCS